MSILDKVFTSKPINKTAALVVSISKEEIKSSPREEKIKRLKEEMRNIDNCLLSIKNCNFISPEERKKIIEKKMAIQNTLHQLRTRHKLDVSKMFDVVFVKVAKERLSNSQYSALRNETMEIIKGMK